MTKRRLFKAVENLDIQKKDLEYEIPGVLGFTLNGENTVEVPTRDSFVYVRLRNNQNELIQAFNDQVSPVYGLPVLVTRDRIDKGRYKVVGRDLGQYQNWGSSTIYAARHGNQHSFNPDSGGGGDIVWVFGRQFMPLLGYPSGSSAAPGIIVHSYTYYDGSNWNYIGNTGTADLTTYKPTGSNARIVLVYIDESGNPNYEAGSYFDASITGVAEIVPYIPNPPTGTAFPVSAVRLVSGTSTISWGNLYDVRPFYDLSGTSSGLGGAGGGAPDDASYITLGLDADLLAERQLTTGTHTTVTDGGANGTVAINVSPQGAGSGLDADSVDGWDAGDFASGSHNHYQGSILDLEHAIPIYDAHVFQVTGTAIDFTDNLDVSVSGTFVFVSSTGGGGSGARTVNIYEDGVFQVTGTALNFEDQLSVDITGSTAHIGIEQGAGSGLDADTLDGNESTAFSSGSHTHYQASILDLQHALVITEDSVFQATGTAIDFGTNMNVAVTGSVVFVSSIDTVGGGGGGDLLIYDDSVFNVTGTAISFDDNLTVHVTGSIAYIEGTGATGSAGATGPPGDNTTLIYDDSVFQVTGTSISFDDNLDVAVTGSVAFVTSTGGGGGNSTYTDTFVNRPSGTVNDGDLFFAQDGFTLDRVSGSSSFYQPFGPIFPFVAPINDDFTWINQGGASIDVDKGGIYLLAPAGAGNNLRIRKKSAPSPPYVITAAFLIGHLRVSFSSIGLCWRQSSDGKLISLGCGVDGSIITQLGSNKYNSPTSFNASYVTVGLHSSRLIWLRIEDNNTNRICYWSHDGQHWVQIHSVGRTDFITADEIGFFTESNNATYSSRTTLLSWKEE